MFNLLISFDPKSWNGEPYTLEKSRVGEYTEDKLATRYKDLSDSTSDELLKIPALFVVEGDKVEARIGYIRKIQIYKGYNVIIKYEFDGAFKPLPIGSIKDIAASLDIRDWEFNRTHWAIKDEDLFQILLRAGLIDQKEIEQSEFYKAQSEKAKKEELSRNERQIFIVHGHDSATKLEMKKFIESIGLEPIILHEQVNQGRTIIEKIEAHSNVGLGVILYTPCDIGAEKAEVPKLQSRARQNVVFEHGYLIGRLGRSKVITFVKGEIEKPNDISGVVYNQLDEEGEWKNLLINELKRANYKLKE